MQKYSNMKKVFANFLYYSDIGHTIENVIEPQGQCLRILTYHRLQSWTGISSGYRTPIELGVEASVFEAQMRLLRDKYNVINLENVYDWLIGKADIPPKAVTITFDDGYRDIFDFAFPILKKMGLPATVFLPSAYIETSRIFWWDMLTLALRDGNISPDIYTWLEKVCPDRIYSMIRRICSLQGDARGKQVEAIVEEFKKLAPDQAYAISQRLWKNADGVALNAKEYAILSWDQVREMSASGVMDFGSHTINHSILTKLSSEAVFFEMQESKRRIEEEIGKPVISFSYPSGAYSNSVTEMARKVGYYLAVTTVRGVNRREANPFVLKRIGIGNITDALFEMQLSSAYQDIRQLIWKK